MKQVDDNGDFKDSLKPDDIRLFNALHEAMSSTVEPTESVQTGTDNNKEDALPMSWEEDKNVPF